MKELEKYKVILWDFDGVIMDSMPVRDKGFQLVLEHYPNEQVDELMKFHRGNGGLSRYVKFRHFFNTIRNEEISDERIGELAAKFSEVMLDHLLDEKLFIRDSLDFIRDNHQKFEMHIVSGSDGTELNHICRSLSIANYFKSICGSPTPKTQLVQNVLLENRYDKETVTLIGDSINDMDASRSNGIDFWGYNNLALLEKSANYIYKFGTTVPIN